jgi:hypothetical protein
MRTFCQSAALALAAGALYFLLRNHDRVSADLVAYVARSKWEIGPGVLKGLAVQRADAWIGCVLLGSALLLQTGSAIAYGRWKAIAERPLIVVLAFLLSGLVLWGAAAVSHRLASDTQARVRGILTLPPATQISWSGEEPRRLRERPSRSLLHEG